MLLTKPIVTNKQYHSTGIDCRYVAPAILRQNVYPVLTFSAGNKENELLVAYTDDGVKLPDRYCHRVCRMTSKMCLQALLSLPGASKRGLTDTIESTSSDRKSCSQATRQELLMLGDLSTHSDSNLCIK